MSDLPDLARRFSRAAQEGRGIRLSAEDLDLLFAVGANDALQESASKYLRDQCLRRSAASRSINGGNSGLNGTGGETDRSDPPASRSSGTTSDGEETEALRRARRTSRKPK